MQRGDSRKHFGEVWEGLGILDGGEGDSLAPLILNDF